MMLYRIGEKLNLKFVEEPNKSETLHPRYFLCAKGGLRYDKGFQESIPEYNMDVSLLDKTLFEEVFQLYSPSTSTLKIVDEYHWAI